MSVALGFGDKVSEQTTTTKNSLTLITDIPSKKQSALPHKLTFSSSFYQTQVLSERTETAEAEECGLMFNTLRLPSSKRFPCLIRAPVMSRLMSSPRQISPKGNRRFVFPPAHTGHAIRMSSSVLLHVGCPLGCLLKCFLVSSNHYVAHKSPTPSRHLQLQAGRGREGGSGRAQGYLFVNHAETSHGHAALV